LEDKDLIKLYKSGQQAVMEILVERYKNPLYKLCYHLASNRYDTDDLFQETWVRVVKNINSYDEDKPFAAWLYSICTNLYKDKYRSKKRWLNRIKDYFTNEKKEEEMGNVENNSFLPEEQIIDKYNSEVIRKCVNMLDDTYRLPIILYYFKELSYSDVALVLNIPLGTVKSRLSTGKKKLKQLMEVEQFE